jgi:hypothetical protein
MMEVQVTWGELLDKLAAAARVGRERVRLHLRKYEEDGGEEAAKTTFVVLLDEIPTAAVAVDWGGSIVSSSWFGTNQETTPEWDAAASAIWRTLQQG